LIKAAAGGTPVAAPQQRNDARRRRQRLFALCALLFPLIFLTVVVVGVASMQFDRLALFRHLLPHQGADHR
jgi:hypothetical protein